MPEIEAIDSVEIHADPKTVFDVVSNYENISKWFPGYRCRFINKNTLCEGATIEHIYGRGPIIVSRFTRRINKVVDGARLEETYIGGDLRGKGVWSFQGNGDCTVASYWCEVSANTVFKKIMFKLLGAKAHSSTFQSLLAALKVYCEDTVNKKRQPTL